MEQSDDRRRTRRHRVWLPVEVDGLAGKIAVTHDASPEGALMVTAEALEVGAEVTLRLNHGSGQSETKGRVVRVERYDRDTSGLWRYRMAVEFEEAKAELADLLAGIERRGGYVD